MNNYLCISGSVVRFGKKERKKTRAIEFMNDCSILSSVRNLICVVSMRLVRYISVRSEVCE